MRSASYPIPEQKFRNPSPNFCYNFVQMHYLPEFHQIGHQEGRLFLKDKTLHWMNE